MRIVKATYDKQADASYIQINKGKYRKTLQVKFPLLVDVDSKGKLLGIEILNVSKLPKQKISR